MKLTPAKKTYREYVNEAKEKIRELFQKETAMHVTEIRVRLDGSVDPKVHFFHWITYDALKELHNEGELRRRPRKGQIHVEGEEKVEVEHWFPSKEYPALRRSGFRAVIDTRGMSEDEKINAIDKRIPAVIKAYNLGSDEKKWEDFMKDFVRSIKLGKRP